MSGRLHHLNAVPERVLTREELAEVLHVSVRQVDKWRAAGMPWHHWGQRLVRFRLSEVDRWLAAREAA